MAERPASRHPCQTASHVTLFTRTMAQNKNGHEWYAFRNGFITVCMPMLAIDSNKISLDWARRCTLQVRFYMSLPLPFIQAQRSLL